MNRFQPATPRSDRVTTTGIPWLGFVVYPSHRLLKSSKSVHASQRLTERFDAWRQGRITFAEFDASVQGWINHVRYADTWGLQDHMLSRFSWGPEQGAAAAAEKNRARPRVARPPFRTSPGT